MKVMNSSIVRNLNDLLHRLTNQETAIKELVASAYKVGQQSLEVSHHMRDIIIDLINELRKHEEKKEEDKNNGPS